MEESISKRGSNGGNARKEKLSPERRKEIAKEAAKKRWSIKKGVTAEEAKSLPGATIIGMTIEDGKLLPTVDVKYESTESPDPKEKRCPACVAGQSLEEGEGTHILATVEHPVAIPAAFADAEAVISIPQPQPAPQKPPKRQSKPMPKEFKSASSYAEKRLPQAIKEKSDHVGAVARLDAEINDLVRVIKALGGTVDSQAIQSQTYASPYAGFQSGAAPISIPPQIPQLPLAYQPDAQPATPIDIPAAPRRMKTGGAGAVGGIPDFLLQD